ncbi:D-inositol-3-phosphate glycosyltransferase [Paraburkholderia fynbosensis]|uniref:D-inositol-3-phosphate glycosyltransferase n=1 Tax=Paraburkholderia fynbosensis TaxID=1200993 RepID=A0A6J5FW57_9BURK|nr:D-inositol-3-phosphate glycosyltransferase [Paraburkholderia fynbosensis]
MRILIIAQRFPVLSETFIIEQARALRDAGADVSILGLTRGDDSLVRVIDRECPPFESPKCGASRAAKILAVAQLVLRGLYDQRAHHACRVAARAVLQRRWAAAADIARVSSMNSALKYEAVVAHFGMVGVRAQYLRDAGLISGALVTVFHGHDVTSHRLVRSYRREYLRLFRCGQLFLPVSQFLAERIRGWGCDSAKIHVSRMGVDIDKFPFSRCDSSPTTLRILLIGRMTEKKGVEYAIRAMAYIKCAVKLTIVGSGQLENALRALVAQLNLESHVRFLGGQPHEKVRTLMSEADIFVLPSVTASDGDMEGVPVVLMEAMASGVITVSSRHGGIPELIDHGVSGFLVNERDSVGLAKVIDEISAGMYNLTEIAANARHKIEARFNAHIEAVRLLEKLTDVCNGNHALPGERSHQCEPQSLTRRFKEAGKSLLPDALFLRLLHKKCIGRFPRLRKPITFNEQILQRNLRPDPRYAVLSDKLATRAYVERKLGSQHVVPLIAAPADFCREVYDSLPDQFVMKANHGSSFVKIVRDKSATSFEELKQLEEKWLSTDFYWIDRERHYREIKPRIFFETLLLDRDGNIPADFKIHCFSGNLRKPVMYILVISDRFGSNTRGDVYDASWNRMEIAIGPYKRSDQGLARPSNLNALLKAAATLASDFEYVRVDLYAFDNRLYFGELTFTPGAGVLPFTPDRVDYEWGELLSAARGV